jgi:hypothetical protein
MVSTSMLLEFGWILIPWEYFDGEGKSSRSLSPRDGMISVAVLSVSECGIGVQ